MSCYTFQIEENVSSFMSETKLGVPWLLTLTSSSLKISILGIMHSSSFSKLSFMFCQLPGGLKQFGGNVVKVVIIINCLKCLLGILKNMNKVTFNFLGAFSWIAKWSCFIFSVYFLPFVGWYSFISYLRSKYLFTAQY